MNFTIFSFISVSIFVLQIFRSLESPAEDNRISDLRENVIIHREQFLKKVTFLSNAADLSNFNVSVSTELEKYEFVSGSAPLDLYACLPFGFIRYTHQPFNPDLSLSSPDLRECDALRIFGHLIGIFDIVVCTKNVINLSRMRKQHQRMRSA